MGKLLCLSNTRPNITFPVQQLSQFLDTLTKDHVTIVKHVLRYLKGTIDLGLFYAAKSTCQLHAYVDADWATCPNTQRSVTGFYVFLGSSLVSWHAKK